jgi:hypothetical protein
MNPQFSLVGIFLERVRRIGLFSLAFLLAGCSSALDPADSAKQPKDSKGERVSAKSSAPDKQRKTEPKVLAEQGDSPKVPLVEPRAELFIDATKASGIDFEHFNGAGGDFTLAEITGAGGALFDFDNDGDLDVYLIQGKTLKDGQPPPKSVRLGNRLYRNDTLPGESVRFTDVTKGSGAEASGYGMGVATGDFDKDGWIDLYVTNLGSNYLLKNNGDGSFADVTKASDCDDARWSTSASFVDVDGDGWLDLFVTNYVDFSADVKRECFSNSSARDYCGPDAYDAVSDRLLRNRATGRLRISRTRPEWGRSRVRDWESLRQISTGMDGSMFTSRMMATPTIFG